MNIKFWKWLYFLAKKKIKEAHLVKHHNDMKCPNCNEWHSISGLKYNHDFLERVDGIISTRCGQCQKVSYWNQEIAPVLVLCNRDGIPLKGM
jgi:C4-type Zn-finger protein